MNLKIRSEVDSIELTAIARRTAAWKTATWSVGIKGKMKGMFSRVMVHTVENTTKRYVTDEVCWLLLEKIVVRSGSEELKTHLFWGMDGASLKHLVRVCTHQVGCRAVSPRCKTAARSQQLLGQVM